ncbi:MAG: four helix bundle protein [Endomicrobiales bacterium]|nr:four helix bundle protein [Endomicrobiales bacterium]
MAAPNDVRIYDLEKRTFEFAKLARDFVSKLPKTIVNREDGRQLIRSSGSVGANYIEANEALSAKDKLLRLKICRKEAKESAYWLKLALTNETSLECEKQKLTREATELTNIFGSIILKLKQQL